MTTPLLFGRGPHRAVVLHGWFGDAAGYHRAFEPMFDAERFTFAFLDSPGYGARKGQAGPFNMAAVARDAIALADSQGWERFAIIGHSMGGKAALRVAVDAPARVTRIIGITPVWAGAAPFDAATLGFFRAAAGSLDVREAIIDKTTGERLPRAWTRAMADRSTEISDQTAFAAYFESWAFDDFEAQAAAVAAPVLTIVGAKDAGVPEAGVRATWLATLKRAEIAVLAECGHYPMDECPLILGATIAAFLAPDAAR